MQSYQLKPEQVLQSFQSSFTGLSSEEAHARISRYGHNKIIGKKKSKQIVIFFRQFLNPLVYILGLAATIKAFVKGPFDALVIIAVLLFMAIVGFIQESRAENAMEALLKLAAPKAKVRRDNKLVQIESERIVPGDVVILEAGDQVPADGRLIESVNLKINEASLTGESLPIEKNTDLILNEVPLAERKNMVYMGTNAVYGRAQAVITATGMDTEIGKIASAIQSVKPQKTSLQKNIDGLGKSLIWIVMAACSLLVVFGIWNQMKLVDLFLMAVAAAVAAIPEGLPAVVTVVLAAGMQRMAKHNAIVRKLVAVETLGSTTVICSDKTGTLTLNEMTVRKIYVSGKWVSVTGEGYKPEGSFIIDNEELPSGLGESPELKKLFKVATLCNDAVLSFKGQVNGIVGDPTEGALIVASAKAGISKDELEKKHNRIDEVPFQSEKQMMLTLNRDEEQNIVCVKGSLERVLAFSGYYFEQGKEHPLTEAKKRDFSKAAESMASDAMRVLALAYANRPKKENKLDEERWNGKLVLIGLVGIFDPPREEAKRAIASCRRGGIKVVMVTGDNPLTAKAIGNAVGIEASQVLSGKELSHINDDDLADQIEKTSVFARIEPIHKLRIVKAFKKNGHIVAMTGDGVNDAPALEEADIGIAMGITGTDVAKEASDMVLADDNFASIITAVEEGRAIFNRLRNVILFLLTTAFGELLALMLGVLFLRESPLVPLQILWINLVTGALIAIPLGLEPLIGDELDNPPRNPKVGLIFPGMLLRVLMFGTLLGFGAFMVFLWTYRHYELHEARTMAFCSIVIFEWLVAFNARSDDKTIFKIGLFENRALIWAVIAGIILQLMVVYMPFLHIPFDTVSLRSFEWGIAALPGLCIFFIETVRKMVAPRLFSLGKWQPASRFKMP